ncbi:MAG: hypothetical protein LUP94_00775 [Candidatus Methanomethylicus sp.]|nr:hypothetical protein [Candidatus Methanomethylicus sp.]
MNTMNQIGENKYCQNCCADLTSMTNPDRRRALRIKKIWWKWKRYAWYIRVLGPVAYFKKRSAESQQTSTGKSSSAKAMEDSSAESQNLQVDDMVEVKSEREIFETLDSDGKLKGLRFTPEMSKYCGKRLKVYRRIHKLIIESTGEMRSMKSPTFLLEGSVCDGSAHSGCERTCFLFWRGEWLRKVA